ncbi:MAG: Ca-activated chloride channel, partial [Pseudomonadota bacterium]|nr:Ca-activated chloride channel [Pseudomonadota bacterium]
PMPQPAQAMSWDELWKNDNQRAAEKFSLSDPQAAAELFKNPEWRAAASYRAGNFDQAAQTLQGINTSDAHYNRGNALAKLGNIDDAIKAYDEALKINPRNEDALYNKQLLQKQKDQDQSGKQGDSSDKNQSGDQQKGDNEKQQSGRNKSDNDKTDDGQSGQNEKSKQAQSKTTESDTEQSEQSDNSANHPSPQPSATAPDVALPPASMQSSPARGERDKRATNESVTAKDLNQQATEQWLRKIPDDPGGLLRRKFKYQYQQQSKNSQGGNSW